MEIALPDLVEAPWLAAHADRVRIADVRWYLDGRSGRDAHRAGHIPGAVWVDIDTDLSDPPGPGTGRHPLPSPQRFAAAMTRAGIGDHTPVVAHDDAGGSIAARLWWLLRMLGHPVALLDGGLASWPGPLETGDPDEFEPGESGRPGGRAPGGSGDSGDARSAGGSSRGEGRADQGRFTPRPWPTERLATADQVAALTARAEGEPPSGGSGGVVVVDARTPIRFAQGDPEIDPRPGHIPGARNAPWAGNLDEAGRFKAPEELRYRFALLGIDTGTEVVAYCGSGVTACHDLLALTRAGVTDVRLYPGSWSQWGADESRPVQTGTPEPPGG